MKTLRYALLCTTAILAANTLTHAAKLLPLNDNTAAPYTAVYRWGQRGCIEGRYDAYAQWLNRKGVWAEDFMPNEGWDKIMGEEWQFGTWGPWVQKDPKHRRYILSVPLLPGPWDRSGPRQGPGQEPVSLKLGAEGKYNTYFETLAKNLVKYKLGNTILRLGWEFNGGWYTWRVDNAEEAKFFAEYFRQIVTTMRAVPGTQDLKFCWNPNVMWMGYDIELAYPGDEFVDDIGIDIYDQSWIKNTYPIPSCASESEIMSRQKRAWNEGLNNKNWGLQFWAKFAKRHKKPLSIPEWGVFIREDGHGGGDNPFFIEEMYKFIHNPDNNVIYHCYFDVHAGDGDHQLVPEPNRTTQFPKSAEKFHELFVLPKNK
jgi:hypothetical protein